RPESCSPPRARTTSSPARSGARSARRAPRQAHDPARLKPSWSASAKRGPRARAAPCPVPVLASGLCGSCPGAPVVAANGVGVILPAGCVGEGGDRETARGRSAQTPQKPIVAHRQIRQKTRHGHRGPRDLHLRAGGEARIPVDLAQRQNREEDGPQAEAAYPDLGTGDEQGVDRKSV